MAVAKKEEATIQETTLVPQTDNGQCFMVDGSAQQSYSSLTPSTPEEAKAYFNMLNSPVASLRDHINMVINLRHVYVETCQYTDKQTGEIQPGVRIVLIDDKGVSYNTSSKGIYNGLAKLFQIFGTPESWTGIVPIRIKQISKNPTQAVLTFEIV